MSRQDISMDAVRGEVETTDNLVHKTICTFMLLESPAGEDNDRRLYAEVALTPALASRCGEGTELRICIPYIADTRELQVRLRTDGGNGMPEYRLNPETNRVWYTVAWENPGGQPIPVRVSEVWKCNGSGNCNLVVQGGMLLLYSADETDLMMRPSLGQNETFLLKAFAGNLYQHPVTGVGLIEYLHGNFENTGLAAKLQSEFTADGMIIHNAYMDSTTGELMLDVTEKNG